MTRFAKRCVATFTAFALVLTQTAVRAGPHDEGIAAGQAANPVARGGITAPNASSVVPGYTATPGETIYYKQPNLNTQGQARLAQCATQPNDPVCQAQRGAVSSANTPRPAVSPTDPEVAAAREIGRSPSDVLGNLSAFYSGCTTTTTPVPAGTQTRTCLRYDGIGNYSCARQLTVEIGRTTNCRPGDWFARAGHGPYSLDVQCFPNRPASAQHMRVTRGGQVLNIFDVDMNSPAVFPEWIATLGAYTSLSMSTIRTGMWVANKTCSGGQCSLNTMIADEYRENCTGSGDTGYTCTNAEPFLRIYAPCGVGTQSGDHIQHLSCGTTGDGSGCTISPLDVGTCYLPSKDKTPLIGSDDTGAYTATYWKMDANRPVIGWKVNPEYGPPSSIPVVPLAYPQPATTVTETDHWDDTCPDLSAIGTVGSSATGGGRCTASGAATCTDGPATKIVDGAPVTRACWAYSRAITCTSASPTDQCAPLAASGCTPVASVCKQTQPGTGQCAVFEDSYSCPVSTQTVTTASNCPSNVFCLNGNCFNTSSPPDADFAHSMSLLEAARLAGVYINTDEMVVFSGESHWCRDRLLKNCCHADSAGAGMTNQSVFGAGTRLVYDVLMNSGNREFLYYGMQALLTSGGFSGSFTSFGVTVAVNGTALPAGSTVIFSGQSIVVAVDPWTLIIAIIIYVVMSKMSCNEEEGRLAMQEGAKLCHTVGTWCSDCHKLSPGICGGCKETTTSKCCFNSMLARIIQEQGRTQIGKGWGDPKSADCSGFTVTQLQGLNFAAMDLSEFYASLVPTMPNVGGLQGQSASRVPSCYYGQGKC